jgi:SAM-dependent methyltransferase
VDLKRVDAERLKVRAYDPKEYWIKRGESYREHLNSRRKGRVARNYDAQEKLLPEVMTVLRPESVLEVGCGYGRMTALISKVPSVKSYDAVDLSPHNIEEAKRTVNGVRFTVGDFVELKFDGRYDVVFACEVLMHILPGQVEGFMMKMRDLSNRYVVSLDYCVDRSVKLEPSNFNHDYKALYERISVKRLEEKRLESKRFFGTEVHPQLLFIADFQSG